MISLKMTKIAAEEHAIVENLKLSFENIRLQCLAPSIWL